MITRQYSFLFLFLLTALGCSRCKTDDANAADRREGHYKNPVFTPVFADPSVIKGADGYFYGYATEDGWTKGTPPHIVPIIRSKDLVQWEFVRDAFTAKPAWKSPAFVWAPDVNYVQGKYYLYYSLSVWNDPDPGIGLAISETPAGPFSDHGKLLVSSEVGVSNSIDPFFYEEGDSKYLFWGSFRGIYGIALTPDGKAVTGDKFQVAGDWMEGTYIIRHGDYYYLFGSNGHCCLGPDTPYKVLVGRSENLKGPYTNKEGQDLLTHMGSLFIQGNDTFVGPGHNAEIITDNNGTDWFLYHGIDKKTPYLPNGATRRPLMLDKITWKDGWPEIEDQQPSTVAKAAPVFK